MPDSDKPINIDKALETAETPTENTSKSSATVSPETEPQKQTPKPDSEQPKPPKTQPAQQPDIPQTKETAETPSEPKKEPKEPEKIPQKPEQSSKIGKTSNIVQDWLKKTGWKENPFTFSINPELFVGYKDQTRRILMAIEEKHKIILLYGPTGSGKTTLLKWITGNLSRDFDTIYIAKPPEHPDEFVNIFNNKFKRGFLSSLRSNIKNIYQIPDFLAKKLKNKHLVVIVDEAHEAKTEVLEWLRVLSDQVEGMSLLISGLPVFEQNIRSTLETFRKRISAKVELLSITKEETRELISRRIRHVGGKGDEFNQLIDYIFNKTNGFPREIIRLCDEIVNQAILKDTTISEELIAKEEIEEEYVYSSIIEKMTPLQKQVIELLGTNAMSPGQLVDTIGTEKYKSRQHAVRSINNIVKRLYEDGYLERLKAEKTFVYSLSGKLRTIVVKR